MAELSGDQHPSRERVKSTPWGGAAGGARFEPSELLWAQQLRVTQATAGQSHLSPDSLPHLLFTENSRFGKCHFWGILGLGLCQNLF